MEIPDDLPMSSTGELAWFLGGSDTSFTGVLLGLVAKADPGNKARINKAFPEVVAAYDMWATFRDPPTPRLLRAALSQPLPEPLIPASALIPDIRLDSERAKSAAVLEEYMAAEMAWNHWLGGFVGDGAVGPWHQDDLEEAYYGGWVNGRRYER